MPFCMQCGYQYPDNARFCGGCGQPVGVKTVAGGIQADLPAGHLLRDGRYRIHNTLGQGGFGITYLAEDTLLKTVRVVKEYYPEGAVRDSSLTVTPPVSLAADHQALTGKFLEEAQTIAAFHHPGIIKVIDFFYANNTAYYVTEYAGGQSLRQLLANRGIPFRPEEIDGWLRQVADALSMIHAQGILHQDIKPDNIIITDSGKAVLIDFGAARAYTAGKTKNYSVTYTLGYAPPEQQTAQGKRGPYTDIYALGATLYELLTKELPADAALRYIQPDAFVRPEQLNRQLSGRFDEALVWALAILPENRPQTMVAFMEKWEDPSDSLQPHALPPPPDCPVSPDSMVYVEGGSFIMGDTFGDGCEDEKPTRQVTVRSFYIGKYTVTFEEYEAFCQATGADRPDDKGWGRGRRPVVNVTWYDAILYCNWRNEQERLNKCYIVSGKGITCDFTAGGYRLPTEAEWEYAAKGGSHSKGYKYSGGNNRDVVAWYKENAGEKTHPVGQKQPNELGIYDMSGNIWEWCWDWYVSYSSYDFNPKENNPIGASTGSNRVRRGGSWNNGAREVRSSTRLNGTPRSYSGYLGFRLVRTSI